MNQWYGKAREKYAAKQLSWASDTIKAMLVSAVYTPSIDTDSFVSDIPSGAIIARSVALTGKTDVLGVLDADDVLFPSVSAGQVGQYVIVYRDSGADSTSDLQLKFDTAPGLPVTTIGGDVGVQWPVTPNKIARL